MAPDCPLLLHRIPYYEPDDYCVLDAASGAVVGRIYRIGWRPPDGLEWFWSLTAYRNPPPTRTGKSATREAAMVAFRTAWLACDFRG